MGINVKPGRYRAVLRITWPSRYIPHTRLFTEICHHILVSVDGEVTETHFESNIPGGVGEDTNVCRFDPPRRWDPELLKSYQLIPER